MLVGSLFTGIGGLDLGLEHAGMRVVWQCERDEYCRRVLAKHWPGIPCYADVRDVEERSAQRVDLVCGGFPCQPFSVAGKRKGEQDERNLWPEMLRVVGALKPKWVMGENVPGIVPTEYFERVCGDLERLDYEVLPLEIPALAFGAPHIRYRLFVVAHSKRERLRLESGRRGGPSREGSILVERNGAAWNVADANGERQQQPEGDEREKRRRPSDCGAIRSMAEATVKRRLTRRESHAEEGAERREPDRSGIGASVADAHSESSGRPTESWGECNQWSVEPYVGRVAHGVPARVDRLRALGNAVVPQVAEWIGRRIIEADK